MRVTGIVPAIVICVLTPQGEPGDRSPAFPRDVQGEWIADSAEWAGMPVPVEIARQIKVTIKQATITVSSLNFDDGKFQIRGKPVEFGYRIDTSKKPNAIDLFLKDDDGEYRQLGIYALGRGQLKLCWQHDGKQRPTQFKTIAEPTQMLVVLKRPAAKKVSP